MLARHVEEDGGLRIPEGGGGKASRPWQGKVSWPDFIPSPREDQAWRLSSALGIDHYLTKARRRPTVLRFCCTCTHMHMKK